MGLQSPADPEKDSGFCRVTDRINSTVGRITAYLILVSVLTVSFEVIARYFFNRPTKWMTEVNIYILCAYIFLGGGFAMMRNGHVRVDVFWGQLTQRRQAYCDVMMSSLFFAFVGVLVWNGFKMTLRSYMDGSTSSEAMQWPLYPSQMMVPLGGLLLLFQGIAKLYRDIARIRGGA